MGGGQPERAAASALGNIVFSWLLARDIHSAWTPPPNPTRAVLSQSQGFLERALGGGGPPSPPPRLALLLELVSAGPSARSQQLLALAFPLSQTVHCCWPSTKEPGRRSGGPSSAREHAPLLLPRGPLQSPNLLLLWQQGRGGEKEREEGQGGEWV